MFDVAQFSSYLKATGTQKSNLFYANIPVPNILLGGGVTNKGVSLDLTQIGKDIEFRARATSLPATIIQASSNHRYGIGPLQKSPTNVQFSDLSFTFIADKRSNLYAFFYQWFNSIFGFDEVQVAGAAGTVDAYTFRSAFRADYVVTPEITLCDTEGNPETTIQLIEAWPIGMQEIHLDWADNNHLVMINVVFTFRNWEMLNTVRQISPSLIVTPPTYFIPARENSPFWTNPQAINNPATSAQAAAQAAGLTIPPTAVVQ